MPKLIRNSEKHNILAYAVVTLLAIGTYQNSTENRNKLNCLKQYQTRQPLSSSYSLICTRMELLSCGKSNFPHRHDLLV